MSALLRVTVGGNKALLNPEYIAGILPDINNSDKAVVYCIDPVGMLTVDESFDVLKKRWKAVYDEDRPWRR